MFWSALHIFEIVLWFVLAASVAYVVFFAIISLFYEKDDFAATHAKTLNYRERRFLILFPAYNEDGVILNSVDKFLYQDYPTDKFRVVVISDHMTDETNEKLRTSPITLLTPVFEKSSKAKAMQYAINYMEERERGSFDNVVVLDADNVVQPDFLHKLNILCNAGYEAIQCHRCAKNANNDVAMLDGASEEINNTIFRKAHNRLGLSSALIGSGMCFSYQLFQRNVFLLSTAGEDREMEALLLRQKVFIKYAAEIHVFDAPAHAVDDGSGAESLPPAAADTVCPLPRQSQLHRQDHPAGAHPTLYPYRPADAHRGGHDRRRARLVRQVVGAAGRPPRCPRHRPTLAAAFGNTLRQGARHSRSRHTHAEKCAAYGPQEYRLPAHHARQVKTTSDGYGRACT